MTSPERARGQTRGDVRDWVALFGWIALSLSAGAVGAVASLNAREFYATLNKPIWAPPGWLFGPVWTVLYVLMGVSAWLVWREPAPAGNATTTLRGRALVLFVVQLVLNALWTWLFFRWQRGALSAVEIVALWLLIAWLIALFARMGRVAAWLLVPYLVWVTYAAALTFALWRANADRL